MLGRGGGDGLLDQLQQLQAKALGILARAESAGDLRSALGAIREVRSTLELVAKVTGELRDKGRQDGDQQVQVNFVIGKGYVDRLDGPEWSETVVEGEVNNVEFKPVGEAGPVLSHGKDASG